MNEWKEVKLGDLIDIKHGYAFKGEFFSEEPTVNILITPGNFKIGGGFKEGRNKYYTGEIPREFILKEGDVIVTMTDLSKNGDTLGYSAIIPKSNNKCYLHNQRIGRLVFKSSVVDKYFLYWRMRSYEYQQFIVAGASGTTVKHTSPKNIAKYNFALPPLPEQKAIADTLSCLDDKIELNNKINKNLEAQAQAIFKSWFVDFEPFQDGEFVDSELGRIPKGWRVGTLGEVAKVIICGKTPSTKVPKNFGGTIPFITIPDMHDNVYVTKTERYLTGLGVSTQRNKLLPENTICVSCIATPGIVCLTSEISQTNQQINSIICKEDTSVFYVYLKSCNLNEHINTLGSSGSTTKNLNKEQFSKIKIIVPESKIQYMFNELMSPMFEKLKYNSRQKQTLTTLRDVLLPKLMSGEIRVPPSQSIGD